MKMASRPLKHLVNISQEKHVEILIVMSTTCLALLSSVLSRPSPEQSSSSSSSSMTFNQLLLYDCVLHNIAFIHAFIQVSRMTRTTVSGLKNITVISNIGIYFSLNLLCYVFVTLLLVSDKSYIFRVGLPTILFLFDWRKGVQISKSLMYWKAKSNYSEDLVNKTATLGHRLICKTIFKCSFLAFGLYSNVEELRQLFLLTCVAMTCNCVTYVTVFPAVTSLQLQLNNSPTGLGGRLHSTVLKEEDHHKYGEKPQPPLHKWLTIIALMVHAVNRYWHPAYNCSILTPVFKYIDRTGWDVPAEQMYMVVVLFVLAYKYLSHELSKSIPYRTSAINEVQPSGNESISLETPSKPLTTLPNEDIVRLCTKKQVSLHSLEIMLNDHKRAVEVRRLFVEQKLGNSLESLPWQQYNYEEVHGTCCENVIGYIRLPVGMAGPLVLDSEEYFIPMATTEGTLVASTNRGCSALWASGGVSSYVLNDGMTRGPVVRFPTAKVACELREWLQDPSNMSLVEQSFSSTSRFARLVDLKCTVVGRLVYLRFKCTTGDAMGMNMISKATKASLSLITEYFPHMEIISISGNFCTDKKPSAMNWIEGRGKSVTCEAVIPGLIVEKVLKTTTESLVDVSINKNLVGSAMAGSIGGQNAHAANIVAAVFIATGQDPAQVVEGSNCITLMECTGEKNKDLYISCTMPSLETATVGGGTHLPGQETCLKMLGVSGSSEAAGDHAKLLARIICGAVLAGELSLMSALASKDLVKAHMQYNRANVKVKCVGDQAHCPVL